MDIFLSGVALHSPEIRVGWEIVDVASLCHNIQIVAMPKDHILISHLLSADGEVRELLLADGMQALGLSAKLRAQNRPHLLLSLE